MVSSADEFRHVAGPEPNWQENYMFMGFDEVNRCAIYLHLAHVPHRGIVDVRAMTSIDGNLVSSYAELPATEALAAPGVSADIAAPMQRWTLRLDSTGVAGRTAEGWLPDAAGDVPFGFDIEFRHSVEPVDWAHAWSAIGVPNVMTAHYEGGAHWEGRVRVGDQERTASGLLVRDHSWGARDFTGSFDTAWWWPTVFDDGSYLTGVSILREGRWVGFAMEERGHGPNVISDDPWVRPDGHPTPLGYDAAALLCHQRSDLGAGQIYRYESRLHVPVYYEVMGNDRIDDVFSRVTAPDGRTGFGNLEINNIQPN